MKKELIAKEQGEEAVEFISKNADIQSEKTYVLKTLDAFNIKAIDNENCATIVNLQKINDIRGINDFFKATNTKLPEDGVFIGCVETNLQRQKRILKKYPFIIARIYFLFDFVFKRVFPKLFLTRRLYFFITAGRNRVLPKAEALGKLVFCGFKIIEVQEIKNLTYFVCKKTNKPIPDKHPSFGFFFKMQRIGKDNKLITVYKIRTMHPYAEYLQEYIYEQNKLQDGGKFKDDFRITSWGRVFRKLWIDELPMAINFLKGEIKLVGVRPLSAQYLSLYTDELKQKRIHAKPGLVPPFYADLPVSLDDIIQSEMRYLDLHNQHPFKTDFNYFFKAIKNIVFKNARTN
jgi:lipopolysaccharide/colanic/teichoic acid biosynthesis glycosyltransferase